jgi:UDP-2,3-diacylglucosamine hydrolase
MKLGLVAGGGELPIALAEACRLSGRPVFVLRLRSFADAALERYPGAEVGLAELGRTFDLLRREGCTAVCFAGQVTRPDFSALKPDLRGLRALPGAVAAARRGDDALVRFLVSEFEAEGFSVEGAEQVHAGLTLPEGPLGRYAPTPEHGGDLDLALKVARTLGELDIGQAVAVARGVVLAVEAQEGTDALLARCAALPPALRGSADARVGVLVKWPKPIQERRVDLPTLGPATVEGAAAAGLAGIAGEAGGMLVLEREAVIAAADRLGLFVVGL